MAYPLDQEKWQRVRQMLDHHDLDAIVVRAPDNVLYLTNYWTMKGYDVAIFPREGDPTLLVIEPQFREAQLTAWNKDVRFFRFYHPKDPRPPMIRAVEMAGDVLRERKLSRRVGIELSQTSQICDRMVGEPTVYWQGFYDAFRAGCAEVVDAAPLLSELRMIKTPKEIEVAAMIEGHIHAVGVGYKGKVEMARAFTLVWSGKGIATFTATSHRPVVENEPTLVEIWVCADGYWTDLTKNLCPGRLTPEYNRLLDQLLKIFHEATNCARAGAPLGEIDRVIRAGIDAAGYRGQPSHPVAHGVGARAHEPPYSHRAAPGEIRKGMVLAIKPGVYWEGGGGLRLEDNFLITAGGNEKLCSYPDDFRR